MIIDPTSAVGRIRLRVGDFSDLPLFPDEVYMAVLDESNGKVPAAARTMATYILALLSHECHQKLAQIEVFGAERFNNYLKFVKMVINNPNYSDIAPVPYVAEVRNEFGEIVELPLVQFIKDWNANYVSTTQSQDMHLTASFAPGGYYI